MNARYRVSSKSEILANGMKVFTGRVHYYEPFEIHWPHDDSRGSVYKRSLYSEKTGIMQTTPADAQMDAVLMGRELTGHKWPDNVFATA